MTTATPINIATDKGKLRFIGEHLDKISTSPERLAEICYAAGARGEIQCPTACIVVSYIDHLFGVPVVATQFGIRLRETNDYTSYTPNAVLCQFMTNFDRGLYPELVGNYEGDPFRGNATH